MWRGYVSECGGNGPTPCYWRRTSSRQAMSLEIAWPSGNGFRSATLLRDVDATFGRAVADSRGNIHVLLGGKSLRYLLLGP